MRGGARVKGQFNKIVLSCDSCGKELNRWPSLIQKHNFCSWQCGVDGRSKYLVGIPHKKRAKETRPRNREYPTGNFHPRFKNGEHINGNGYRDILREADDPKRKMGQRYKLEHIVIAEKELGRPLKKGEVVHHINGDKLDNRPCNLFVCTNSYHAWIHKRMSELYQQEHFSDPEKGREILNSRVFNNRTDRYTVSQAV